MSAPTRDCDRLSGSNRYEALVSAGARMRTEDVINEAAERLRQFGAIRLAAQAP